jgi:hypothetical protein
MRYRLQVIFLCIAFSAFIKQTYGQRGASVDLNGTVFLDKNENGLRDKGEPGIAGVWISDQNDITVTDEEGVFRLTSRSHLGSLYVT